MNNLTNNQIIKEKEIRRRMKNKFNKKRSLSKEKLNLDRVDLIRIGN